MPKREAKQKAAGTAGTEEKRALEKTDRPVAKKDTSKRTEKKKVKKSRMKKKYLYTAIMLFAILGGRNGTDRMVRQPDTGTDGWTGTDGCDFLYPMYIAAENVIGDADGVRLENLSEPQTGCLHDFQLTPEDMKLLSTADVFIINGGGIESFMKEVAEAYPNLKNYRSL